MFHIVLVVLLLYGKVIALVIAVLAFRVSAFML